jgi:hypothetical protein
MALARPVFFTARTKVTPVQIKRAIYHAKNLCQDYEDCKIAWEIVEELTAELARQHEEELSLDHHPCDNHKSRNLEN